MKKALFCTLALLLVSSATAQTQRRTKADRTSAEAYIRESEAHWAESVASGFRVLIPKDACIEMSEEMHQSALFNFGFVFGRVRNTEGVVKLFATTRAAEAGGKATLNRVWPLDDSNSRSCHREAKRDSVP